MAEAKFPNPSFWRYKDHIDWKAQGENLKQVGGIIADMLRETDWAAVAGRHRKNLALTGKRILEEAKAFAAMPCDGSTMASEYMSRRFPDLPVFHLTFPVRCEYEETVEDAAEDIRHCIKFIEETTGAKWSWDAYFKQMKRFNLETSYELQKWEVNQTPYPQLIGPCYELFRKWNYEMDGGADLRVMKTFEKVNKIMLQAYEKREEAWRGKIKYRAIVWSCPAHYYANLTNWIANCWGVNVLVEMEGLNFTRPLETEDKDKALEDLALTGGCAKNDGLKQAIEHVLKLKVVELKTDPQLMGALGAAEYARRKGMAKKSA